LTGEVLTGNLSKVVNKCRKIQKSSQEILLKFKWWKKPEYPVRTTDHGQATGKLYNLRLRVECTLFCNLQSRVRTHAVLVIDTPTSSTTKTSRHDIVELLLKVAINTINKINHQSISVNYMKYVDNYCYSNSVAGKSIIIGSNNNNKIILVIIIE
jgi:hypothetical protein